MAKVCSYTRPNSPFYWLKWTDSVTGKATYENTKIRPDDQNAARKLARRKHTIEGRLIEDRATSGGEAWHLWVPQWLHTRYAAKPKTLAIYRRKWRWMVEFMAEHQISSPRSFTRDHLFEYVEARRAQVKEKSHRHPSLNTALTEIKLLGMILREAIQRGYCDTDVTAKHGIEREEKAEKPEMSDEDIVAIRQELASRPEWMRIAFEIALGSGMRHAETRIPRSAVRFAQNEIMLVPKGGQKRTFIHLGSDALMAYLKEVFADGRTFAWTADPKILTGLEWTKFFREIKRPHLCFHCTRVTYISRGGRNGVPEAVMRIQVNHASALVHWIYRRIPADERRTHANAVGTPPPAPFGAKPSNPPKQRGARKSGSRDAS